MAKKAEVAGAGRTRPSVFSAEHISRDVSMLLFLVQG